MPTPFDLPSEHLDEAQVADAINRLNAMVFGKTTVSEEDGMVVLTVHDWPGGPKQFRSETQTIP
mgnify:CR=1 FL=1